MDNHLDLDNFARIMENCDKLPSLSEKIQYLKLIQLDLKEVTIKKTGSLGRTSDGQNILAEETEYFGDFFVRTEFCDYLTDRINYLVAKQAILQGSGPLIGERIRWLGTEIQIIQLIEYLIEERLIDVDWNRRHRFVAEHFINKNGEPFDNTQLSKTESRGLPTKQEKIDKIKKAVNRIALGKSGDKAMDSDRG